MDLNLSRQFSFFPHQTLIHTRQEGSCTVVVVVYSNSEPLFHCATITMTSVWKQTEAVNTNDEAAAITTAVQYYVLLVHLLPKRLIFSSSRIAAVLEDQRREGKEGRRKRSKRQLSEE